MKFQILLLSVFTTLLVSCCKPKKTVSNVKAGSSIISTNISSIISTNIQDPRCSMYEVYEGVEICPNSTGYGGCTGSLELTPPFPRRTTIE